MTEEEIQEIITLIGCLDIDDIEPVNKYTANVLRKIIKEYKQLQQENQQLKAENFMKCAMNCKHLQELKYQRDLYKNIIIEVNKLILEKFNKDNYLSCGRVARILSVLDKANIKEND